MARTIRDKTGLNLRRSSVAGRFQNRILTEGTIAELEKKAGFGVFFS